MAIGLRRAVEARLVEGVRIGGKPRQRFIAYIASIEEPNDSSDRVDFWDGTSQVLNDLANRFGGERAKIEASLAAECAATESAGTAELMCRASNAGRSDATRFGLGSGLRRPPSRLCRPTTCFGQSAAPPNPRSRTRARTPTSIREAPRAASTRFSHVPFVGCRKAGPECVRRWPLPAACESGAKCDNPAMDMQDTEGHGSAPPDTVALIAALRAEGLAMVEIARRLRVSIRSVDRLATGTAPAGSWIITRLVRLHAAREAARASAKAHARAVAAVCQTKP